jgi:hypothetical protein
MALALTLSERDGYDAIRPNLVGRMAIALARTGRAEEAVEQVEACFASGLHRRSGQMETYYLHAGYGETLFRCGRADEGFAAIDEAMHIARAIRNPCLLVDGLGLRARLRAELDPNDPGIEADLAEQRLLCDRHGIVAWRGPS